MMSGVTFLRVIHFKGFPPAAEFRDNHFGNASFRLNAEALQDRIHNVEKRGDDVSEEKCALVALKAEST